MSEGTPDFKWYRLLRELRRGQVVPVIGPELLPYHQSLAAGLADKLGVPKAAAEHGIVGVADAYLKQRRDARDVSDQLELLLQNYKETPKALEQLAAIDDFRLIVTTDYASLIERALGNESYRTLAFALNRKADDIDGYPRRERYVYHLLGHFERFGTAAVARVDQLEYLFGLQSADGPSELLAVMRERKNLLFLGCDLPEWLAGFFTRTLVGKPLYETRERGMEVIASRSAVVDGVPSPFTAFLRDNSVDVYDGDAQSFVARLVEEYEKTAQQGVSRRPASPAAKNGHVFVSYNRLDQDLVRGLVRALRDSSLEVWFDETSIQPGSSFGDDIRLAIQEDASAFIAVVSRSVFDKDMSYFVQEWNWANETREHRWKDIPFVFPFIVDDMSKGEAVAELKRRFPDFAALDVSAWEKLPVEGKSDGLVEARFVEALRTARKRYERRRHDRA